MGSSAESLSAVAAMEQSDPGQLEHGPESLPDLDDVEMNLNTKPLQIKFWEFSSFDMLDMWAKADKRDFCWTEEDWQNNMDEDYDNWIGPPM